MRVERTSYGKRILNSFVGLLIGILLFLGSFVVLFVNEGRENLANYAKRASEYNQIGSYEDNNLVYVIGTLDATNYAQDSLLTAGEYIYLERKVEMYGYVEVEHSETKENVGGSTTTVYTYTYELKWIESPNLASSFKGDQNEKPTNIPNEYDTWIQSMPENYSNKATGLTIDGISVSSSNLTLSGEKALALTDDLVNSASLATNESVNGGMIFRKNSTTGSVNQPSVGDVRISYQAITTSDQGILFASIDNGTGSFVSFTTKKDNTFFRFFTGVETQTDAVNILKTEYKTALWLSRFIGFIMMFVGLLLFANPIMTLLSVIPLFAKIGRFAYGIVAFVISLVLTTLTIIIGMIFNNIFLAIAAVLIIVFIIVLVLKKKKNNQDNKKK